MSRVRAVCECWSIPAEKHSEKDHRDGHQHGWKPRNDDDGSRLGVVLGNCISNLEIQQHGTEKFHKVEWSGGSNIKGRGPLISRRDPP